MMTILKANAGRHQQQKQAGTRDMRRKVLVENF